MAALYLMRFMTFLPLPRALAARDTRGARVSLSGAPNATRAFNGLSSQLQMNVGSMD
jgi:hypothetical protein